MLQSSSRRQKEQPACSSAVPEAIQLACSRCTEFAVSHAALLQGTCLYLYLPFYEAPRKKYKPHVGNILPIASSCTDLELEKHVSRTHTASLT